MAVFFMMFFSLYAGAEESLRKQFNDKIHITPKGYFIDGSPKVIKYKCNPYADPKKEGLKVIFISKKRVEYALECKGSEIGTTNNLTVSFEGKTRAKISSVAGSGGDCDYSYSSHFWLEDINSDGSLDFATRHQSSKTDHGCEGPGTGKTYEKSDKISIHIWNEANSKFEKQNLVKKSEQLYKKRFQFK